MEDNSSISIGGSRMNAKHFLTSLPLNDFLMKNGRRISRPLGCFVVLFCLLTNTSCGIKTGLYNLTNYDQPLGIDEEPLRYWEAETHTPRLIKDHVDMTFGVGFNTGKEEGRVETDEHGRWPKVESYMWDVHLGARVFPLGVRDQTVVPYIGGGIGYFEYDMTTNTPDEDLDGNWYYGRYGVEKHQDTLAHGYFSYVSTGLYFRLEENLMLQLEFRSDIDKEYKPYDLSGHKITVGVALMHD